MRFIYFLSIGALTSFLGIQCPIGVWGSSPYWLDPMRLDTQILNDSSFSRVVTSNRDKIVSLVLFCEDNTACRAGLKEFENISKELKGMVNVAVVDCKSSKKLCKQEVATEFPNVVIYPILPAPSFPFEKEIVAKKLVSKLLKLIPGPNVIPVSKETVSDFMDGLASIPKVLLFSESENIPPIYKALSNAFHPNIKFGFVKSNDPLVQKYKVKKFPHLISLKHGQKPEAYKGPINYSSLFDWINVFSETFATGGGFSTDENLTTLTPWKFQSIPEVTKASHRDVCFGKSSKGLCVIYLKDGGPMTGTEKELLEELSNQFQSHLSGRGPEFRWLWLDLKKEKYWKELLNPTSLPSLVIFNPYKKIRYIMLDANLNPNFENIKALIEKVTAGDARFTIVKGGKLPNFEDSDETSVPTATTEL